MPDLTLTAIEPLPLWTAAALLVLLLVVSIVAVRRSGSFGSVGVLFGVAALVVIAFSAWNFAEHSILRQRAAAREALDARALQLTTAAMAPGSPLACLDGFAGEAVTNSCEPAIFRSPETIAAATAYVEARLRLLADGFQYAHRFDNLYYSALDELRSSMEADRYGFVAHVLMKRNGCTVDSCFIFGGLLHDTGRVKANMNERTLEDNVARYADTWPRAQIFTGRSGVAARAAADRGHHVGAGDDQADRLSHCRLDSAGQHYDRTTGCCRFGVGGRRAGAPPASTGVRHRASAIGRKWRCISSSFASAAIPSRISRIGSARNSSARKRAGALASISTPRG